MSTTAGACHPCSLVKIQGYFRAEIMGRCGFLKRYDLSLGPHPGWSCWRTIPGSLAVKEVLVPRRLVCRWRTAEPSCAQATRAWADPFRAPRGSRPRPLQSACLRSPRRQPLWGRLLDLSHMMVRWGSSGPAGIFAGRTMQSGRLHYSKAGICVCEDVNYVPLIENSCACPLHTNAIL